MNQYLNDLEYAPVKSIEEIVAFNKGYHFCQMPPGMTYDRYIE